jgi:hypothetical protein
MWGQERMNSICMTVVCLPCSSRSFDNTQKEYTFHLGDSTKYRIPWRGQANCRPELSNNLLSQGTYLATTNGANQDRVPLRNNDPFTASIEDPLNERAFLRMIVGGRDRRVVISSAHHVVISSSITVTACLDCSLFFIWINGAISIEWNAMYSAIIIICAASWLKEQIMCAASGRKAHRTQAWKRQKISARPPVVNSYSMNE